MKFFFYFLIVPILYSFPVEEKALHLGSCKEKKCLKSIIKKTRKLGIYKYKILKRDELLSVVILKSDLKIPEEFTYKAYLSLLQKKIDPGIYDFNMHLECPEPIQKKKFYLCEYNKKFYSDPKEIVAKKNKVSKIYLKGISTESSKLLSSIPHLKELIIENALGLKVSIPWKNLSGLKKLKIVGSNFFPIGITELTGLLHLELIGEEEKPIHSEKRYSLKKIPEEIGKMENLTYLNLDRNEIQNLPMNFSKLQKLKFLSIESSPLNQSDLEKIFQLNSLEYLNLSNTEIQSLPISLSNLSNLKKFIAKNRFIEGIPVGALFKEFPKSLSQIPNLEELDLEGARFKTLPYEIRNFKNLKILNLAETDLEYISDEIGEMKKLTELNILNKVLKKSSKLILPETMCKLKNLNRIYLDETKLDLKNVLKIVTCLPDTIIGQ
ncbi:MAG: leucine-rich repeat domain-containing protein [Leptospiraceae bacterium]|nr:leucine-rich repeat domain-containing protein [Leptospiraceae bacterium]